jgi:pimeloyl-ACP methyl ester carboxylesterase
MALPQTTALALAGRLEIPMSDGGRAWFTAFDEEFNLIAPSPNETRRAASLAETVELILPLLAALSGSDGAEESGGAAAVEEGLQRAPRRRVHLFGFSQGGTVVLEIARRLCGGSWADAVADSGGGGGGSGTGSAGCRAPAWLGSVVAVSASLLEERLPALEREQRGRDGAAAAGGVAGAQASVAGAAGGFMPRAVPVLITHGDRDEVVPRKAVERWVNAPPLRAGQLL